MTSSPTDLTLAHARAVRFSDEALIVELVDGRTLSVPLSWYPRLAHATAEERGRCRLIANGRGVHWDAIDEDISVEGLLAGRRSGETQASLRRWFESRKTG